MKEVQEKLLPGELGVSPRVSLVISPKNGGPRGLMSPRPIPDKAMLQSTRGSIIEMTRNSSDV